MVIKTAGYSKRFTSETYDECIYNHGSGIWEKNQKINIEDEELREKIEKKFVLQEIKSTSFFKKQGFDGQILYMFEIKDNLYFSSCHNKSENVEYKTTVDIKKQGAEEQLNELCDLEAVLIKNEFKKLD